MHWIHETILSQNLRHYEYFSFSADVNSITIKSINLEGWSDISKHLDYKFKPSKLKLTLLWINNWFGKYEILTYQPISYDKRGYIKKQTLNFTVVQNNERGTIYILKINDYKISWKEASQQCKEISGYLPYLTSRDDLKKLIAFFASSKQLPIIEGLFIGLKYEQSKVSFWLSRTCKVVYGR